MRFQGVSPDSLSRFRSPSRTEDQIFSTYFTGVGDVEGGGGAPLQSKNNEAKLATGNGSGGGDMLLQWGQRKRSSRTENRHVVGVTTTDDSSSSSSTHFQGGVVKGNRRVVAVVEKQKKSVIGGHTMPPPAPSLNPCSTSNGGRAGNLKPPCPKDTIAFSPNWRSSEDRSGCVNGSPPSHSGRPISPRSRVGKRSPNTKEKTEMMNNNNSSKFSSKLKNGLNLSHHDDHNHQEGGEHDENNVKNGKDGGSDGVSMNVWPRIYIPLTRKEKEEDFLAMKGTKLPQRPKKRPKAVERLLQYVYPGMWLGDVSRARYEVKEKKSAKKQRRRGLKGMESLESDSD